MVTSRRCGDAEWAPNLSTVAIKNQEVYLGPSFSLEEREMPTLHTRLPNPEYWCREDELPYLAMKKWGFRTPRWEETPWEIQAFS